MIDNRTLISTLTDIEENVDVNHLTCQGYCVWPLIRFQLAIWLMNQSRPLPPEETVMPSTAIFRSMVRKSIKLGSLSVRRLRNPTIRKTDLAFMIRTSERSHQVAGKWYNPHGDSFCDLFEDNYSIRLLEFSDNGCYPKLKPHPSYSLDFQFSIAGYRKILTKRRQSIEIDGLNDLVKYLEHIKILWPDVGKAVSTSLQNIFVLKETFSKIIEKLAPKLFFITCCYCEKAMAAIVACNDLNIPSVEFQHGAQNDNNPFLTNWTKVPVNGYQLLPKYFWNWGEASSERIRKWTRKSTQHETFVGGNLWISKWLVDGFQTDDCNQYQIENIFPQDYIHILISLQLWPESLPKFIADQIRDSPSNWFWHIRQHPRHPVSYKELSRVLDNHRKINVDFRNASSMPLYLLLKHIDLHLTGFSTVAFEAAQFNVPTIFYHKNAKYGYASIIDDNLFGYVENRYQMRSLIRVMLDRRTKIVKGNDYIQIDKNRQLECLEEMIRFSTSKPKIDTLMITK